ncbi:MAG: serpin family protein [Chitinispirillaceae bacterium]|nr:serpin family protein [Chitinispirillaceae bacterium]
MKYRYLLIPGLTVALLYSCSRNPLGGPGQPHSNDDQHYGPFAVAKSASVPRETGAVSADIVSEQVESNNAFAVALYKELISVDDNLFFSPYSITGALAMTAAGAKGNTKQQMLDALQVTLEGTDFDAALNSYDLSITDYADETDGVTIEIVNSSWMQYNWEFRISYLDHLSRFYGAGVNLLDFMRDPEVCRGIINIWVADQTNQKIENLLPAGSILPETVLVLTNAIYFLGDWLYSFDPEQTNDNLFFLAGGSTVQVPIMSLNKPDEQVGMYYARVGNARALDFPYKGGRLAMTVLLPDEGEFSSFESSLSTSAIGELITALDSVELQVSLPKFEFTYGTVRLKKQLKALGMIDAFDGSFADFSGIDGTDLLYVDDIYHKAFISVDEEGTEAAAATAVVLVWESTGADDVVFNANRPFIYLIRDRKTGMILFMGRVVDPSVTEYTE